MSAGRTVRSAILRPLCPAGHLSRLGEIGCRPRLRQSPVKEGAVDEATNLPLVGEMAGRPEGGAVPPASLKSPVP
ncbi:MAG: hypothetical protein EOS85_23975 [Mesorhizobium sp.]|nr:hypothetical protein EJ075_31805 [Mesorhizobium sp. M6A.T.Cr.TU.016.01.1.1]RWP51843.1 MAG: hypothetical protein EOR06_21750 [Mesorhizobium sp.]RWQ72781.1 MAG: hypothetical protein EOS85_23975 [Mesorhizobium sp.]